MLEVQLSSENAEFILSLCNFALRSDGLKSKQRVDEIKQAIEQSIKKKTK